MKRFSKIGLGIMFLFPVHSFAQAEYTIKKGDTLLKIADENLKTQNKKDPRRFEFAQKIKELNPNLKNPNQLEPGQMIIIPNVIVSEPKLAAEASSPGPTEEKPTKPVMNEIVEMAKASEPVKTPEPPDEIKIEKPSEKAPEENTTQAESQSHAEHHDFIFVQARYQMHTFKPQDLSTKTKSTVESKSGFGLDLQYGKVLNHHWHLLAQGSLTQVAFKDFQESGRTLDPKSKNLKFFGLGAAYVFTDNLFADLLITYADRSFFLPANANDYTLKIYMIPGADFNLTWEFLHLDQDIFGVSGIAEYVSAYKKDNVEYKAAVEPLAALYWKSKFGHESLNYKASVLYKHGHSKTTISDQYEDMIALGFGVYF